MVDKVISTMATTQTAQRFRILRSFHSPAGTGLECCGLTLSAPDAETAVTRARTLFAHLSVVKGLVAMVCDADGQLLKAVA